MTLRDKLKALERSVSKLTRQLEVSRPFDTNNGRGELDAFGNKLTLAIGGICLAVWLLSIPKFDQPAFGSRWRGALYYLKVAVALGALHARRRRCLWRAPGAPPCH